jgi:hypothetical protein
MGRIAQCTIAALTSLWIIFPAESHAQYEDFAGFKAGGGYTYLRFERNSSDAQPYGIHTQYAFDRQWALRTSIGYDRTHLGLFRAGTVSTPDGKSTLIPIQMGVTYSFRPSSAQDAIVDYRTYVTGGISFLNTFYSGQRPGAPFSGGPNTATRYGLLAGPYGAAGFAATTLSDIPLSLDISFIRLYYHRSFNSALQPIDGLTYGAHVMLSVSFMRRGR